MNEALDFISQLRDRGIDLWAHGNELRYKTQSGTLSSEDVQQLRVHKTDILQLLSSAATAEDTGPPPILARDRDGLLVPSFTQQRMWFLVQMEGVSQAYHIPLALRLEGALDECALRQGLDRLVKRHETLRTSFLQVNGEPFQCVGPAEVGFGLRLHDLTDEVDREYRLTSLLMEEVRTPFDLERGPLARGRLIRLSSQDHALLITLHHINADGWSVGILARELSELYGAIVRGDPDPLAALPIQYADYAVWQRQWLSEATLAPQSAYWRKALEAVPAALELPTDRPRPAQQSFAGDVVPISLDEALTTGLKSLSQRYGATLFMTILAGWATVLSRLSGQEDLVVGTPTANRARTEIEGLIGLFVNTLALRTDLSGEPTVEELLLRVRDVCLAAQENQDLPFEQVVELVKPPRSPARSPLFQVMFAWHNDDTGTFDLPGLAVAEIPSLVEMAKYDLSVDLAESRGRIVGALNFATALFDKQTAIRHVDYLLQVLTQMVADVGLPITALDLLTRHERQQILETFNATGSEYPQGKQIHELFEEQVERTPCAAAVFFEQQRLSYTDLNNRANQLAACLRAAGVQPGDRVALCLERGLEMVVGLLGILKSCGAYVPLDPAYPTERVAYMLADATPRVVLTQERLRASLPDTPAEVIALDSDWDDRIARYPVENLAAVGPANALAYVIYTSGSTGKPKGVMVEHAGVVNFLTTMQHRPGIQPTDRLLAVTTVSFDIAALEMYLPLLNGAQLVLASRESAADAQRLIQLLEQFDITVLQATPATWQMLLSAGWQGRANLKALCGGEALSTSLSQALLPRVGALWNLYGPTETTIWSCARQIVPLQEERVSVESIGRPIANTQVYILDRSLQPVPLGVAGEIYIGGAGLARGYLNRPELTEQRFVAHPFSRDPQARVYRTGDLGRWRAEGSIDYLGRNDNQVKIRGYRIELGEIEAQLLRQPQIREAVVVDREDVAGEKRLVAYVTGRDDEAPHEGAPGVERLRAALKAVLPDYMVPSAVVWTARLPRTPNGKLDRRALPAPELGDYVSRRYEAPQGETELVLAGIWQELLHLERIGRQDNFFELGGHSLHGTKLLAKVAERLHVRLSVIAVFRYPTIEQMAEVIESMRSFESDVAQSATDSELEEGLL